VIIAVDGPAASGKGTLGKRLAAHYGLRHLDTGLLYRAVAKAVRDAGHALDDVPHAVAAARALDPAMFDEQALKVHAVGEAASVVSAIPQVRDALFALQRNFAATPPGAVLDGKRAVVQIGQIAVRDGGPDGIAATAAGNARFAAQGVFIP